MKVKHFEKHPYTNTLLEIQLQRLPQKTKKIIVDVGAFDGVNCVRLARKFPNSFTYAIEPCPKNFKVLCYNTKRHKNIKPVQVALSDKDGEEVLFTTRDYKHKSVSSQSNSLYEDFLFDKNNEGKNESVKTMTFDSFCRKENIQHIHLLKMNCEGGEYKIFGGELSELFYSTDIICLYLHGKTFLFMSEEYVRKKQAINEFLVMHNYNPIYGEDLSLLERIPIGHITQVWMKNK